MSIFIKTEKFIQTSLKKLPSVEKVLGDEQVSSLISNYSRNGITRIVREKIDAYRAVLLKDTAEDKSSEIILGEIVTAVAEEIGSISAVHPRRVINASGVVLHTNLGRAVLSESARSALEYVSAGYVDLEIDMASGQRTERDAKAARLLSLLTGSESALVVNNTAAAVLLAVNTFAGEGAVAVSRGELVEIGGSFRLPEILSSAARQVIEVGTTNRTHPGDYKEAIERGATLLLKVHTSNYRILGYTDDVELEKLVEIGRANDIPVMYDQGSGILFPFGKGGPEGEADAGALIKSGVDILCFSADKALGGPQAGLIAGRSGPVERLRKNHLSRALRVDKLTLAALEAVLLQYWTGRTDQIPAINMILESVESIGKKAEKFSAVLSKKLSPGCKVTLVEGESSIGGGSFPIDPLPTILVRIELDPGVAVKLSALLRGLDPAILVRIKDDSIYLDLRTVTGEEEEIIGKSLAMGIKEISGR
ncbi:MAG: L-seryl-tRNA(Sec) selenium transferase [Candidatus Krumholzibacteriota bacterium]|nr:L-seryl-tRNA(Sec) selenium transferase [Candidatus Krumholzibacteriota bacterium]